MQNIIWFGSLLLLYTRILAYIGIVLYLLQFFRTKLIWSHKSGECAHVCTLASMYSGGYNSMLPSLVDLSDNAQAHTCAFIYTGCRELCIFWYNVWQYSCVQAHNAPTQCNDLGGCAASYRYNKFPGEHYYLPHYYHVQRFCTPEEAPAGDMCGEMGDVFLPCVHLYMSSFLLNLFLTVFHLCPHC